MSKRKSFEQFVKQSLTAEQFENLAMEMKMSNTKIRRLLSGTDDFMLDEISSIARVLSVTPTYLIVEYGLGSKNITLDEATELGRLEGLSLEFLPHVA